MTEFTSCEDCKNNHDASICIHCENNQQVTNLFEPIVKKSIDLSMIGSDIDMEFKGASFWWVDKLKRITSGREKYIASNTTTLDAGFSKCRIRQDHWHSWYGGECPLPEGLLIAVRTRKESNIKVLTSYTSDDHGWRWTNPFGDNSEDIIAFKVKGAAYGWKYGWEK